MSEIDRRCAWCGTLLPRGVPRVEVYSPLHERVYPLCHACWFGPESPRIREALGYTVPRDWLVQCSWCGRAKDAWGDPIPGPLPRQPDSHGICNECARALKHEIDAILDRAEARR